MTVLDIGDLWSQKLLVKKERSQSVPSSSPIIPQEKEKDRRLEEDRFAALENRFSQNISSLMSTVMQELAYITSQINVPLTNSSCLPDQPLPGARDSLQGWAGGDCAACKVMGLLHPLLLVPVKYCRIPFLICLLTNVLLIV